MKRGALNEYKRSSVINCFSQYIYDSTDINRMCVNAELFTRFTEYASA